MVFDVDPVRRFSRSLSGLLFAGALGALVLLLSCDIWHRFLPTVLHQKTGALALILVGISFICLQPSEAADRMGLLKGVLLGLAFVLWGGEQFLPAGAIVTAVDSVVITIFVVDLGLVILSRLKGKRD